MTHINARDIQAGQTVMIVATTGLAIGMPGRVFEVLAIEFPFMVIRESQPIYRHMDLRHNITATEFTFAIPSKDYETAYSGAPMWPSEIES